MARPQHVPWQPIRAAPAAQKPRKPETSASERLRNPELDEFIT
jgi:hypothetical protein